VNLKVPAAAPLWIIALGVGFSGLVGVAFGLYPSNKAARMHPIEALRYE
jgi:putative ABC transport system permease protein